MVTGEQVALKLLRLLGVPQRAAVVRVRGDELVLELDVDFAERAKLIPAAMDGYRIRVQERTRFLAAN